LLTSQSSVTLHTHASKWRRDVRLSDWNACATIDARTWLASVGVDNLWIIRVGNGLVTQSTSEARRTHAQKQRINTWLSIGETSATSGARIGQTWVRWYCLQTITWLILNTTSAHLNIASNSSEAWGTNASVRRWDVAL
jgi:hypothetical protein